MPGPYTKHFWTSAEPLYQQILQMPFNEELRRGTLPEDCFIYYMKQDALYLADFGRALALAGTRSAEPGQMLDFLAFAEGAVVVERALHEHYLQEYGATLDIPKSPSCEAYTGYLLRCAILEPLPVALAALLPCFWIYREVGQHILNHAAQPNRYQKWIDTYAGEEFGETVNKAISLTEKAAEETTEAMREQMKEAYLKSTRLEYLFWDAAWRKEGYPI
ncbi:MAG: thiaminase II [Opitutales bacterium]|nr:thiaminase II [Opitutales bacterium]